MKVIAYILFVFLLCTSVNAGGMLYYRDTFSFFDHETNSMVTGTYDLKNGLLSNNKVNTAKISNLLIFDIKNKTKKYVFPENFDEDIAATIFESLYDTEEKRIQTNISPDSYLYKYIVINNLQIDSRKPQNKIIIITRKDFSDQISMKLSKPKTVELFKYTVWACDKNGENLESIGQFDEKDDFHVDIGNHTVRIIYQSGLNTTVKEYEY